MFGSTTVFLNDEPLTHTFAGTFNGKFSLNVPASTFIISPIDIVATVNTKFVAPPKLDEPFIVIVSPTA